MPAFTVTRAGRYMGQDVENRAVAADKVCVDISADPQVIFDLVHDYQRRLEWDPFLQEARLLGGAKEAGRGVRTLCVARSRLAGLGMETVYITYSPPRVAAVQMTRGPWFLKSFAAAPRISRARNHPRCLLLPFPGETSLAGSGSPASSVGGVCSRNTPKTSRAQARAGRPSLLFRQQSLLSFHFTSKDKRQFIFASLFSYGRLLSSNRIWRPLAGRIGIPSTEP